MAKPGAITIKVNGETVSIPVNKFGQFFLNDDTGFDISELYGVSEDVAGNTILNALVDWYKRGYESKEVKNVDSDLKGEWRANLIQQFKHDHPEYKDEDDSNIEVAISGKVWRFVPGGEPSRDDIEQYESLDQYKKNSPRNESMNETKVNESVVNEKKVNEFILPNRPGVLFLPFSGEQYIQIVKDVVKVLGGSMVPSRKTGRWVISKRKMTEKEADRISPPEYFDREGIPDGEKVDERGIHIMDDIFKAQ